MPLQNEDFDYNPLTCCATLDGMEWMMQHSITLLRLVARDMDRDETGSIPTKYEVDPRYVDVDCIATGGGISAAQKNERWEQDQSATFIVKQEPGARSQDAVLFARNVFVIDAVSPVGTIGVAWEIHASRVLHPDEGIRGLENNVLRINGGLAPGAVLAVQSPLGTVSQAGEGL